MAAERADIAIIGGGAAGLAAAIFAAQTAQAAGKATGSAGGPQKIIVLDGATTLGAKILVAGGGRCNVTHDVVTPDDFNGSRNIVRNILAAFDAAAVVRWFAAMGVELKREETGKLFPVTDSARTVLNALLDRCKQLGVTLQSCSKVTGIEARSIQLGNPPHPNLLPEGEETREHSQVQRRGKTSSDNLSLPPGESGSEGDRQTALPGARPHLTSPRGRGTGSGRPEFTITHTAGSLIAPRVILCTGGKSLPRSGSDGSGWEIVAGLGHTVTPTYMALVPLVLGPGSFHAELSGISLDVELTTLAAGKPIDRRRGSLLWTHFGLSGPVVMDASRHWIIAKDTGQSPEMRCSFLPGETTESAEKWLIAELAGRPKAAVVNVFSKKFPERLALALLKHAGVDPATLAGQVSRESRKALLATLTSLPLPIAHGRGWNYAEVTAGGVPLNEIDYRTMQSRKTPGLYLAGEILDCDGRIGGYNFQWAWATGYLAGNAAAKG